MPSHFTKYLPLAALALAVTAACAPADDDGPAAPESAEQSGNATHEVVVDEAKMNLVAEVKKGTYSLKFFEPEPGILMERESGQIGLDDKLAPDVDMLTKYRVLSGENPPRRLVEAYERLQALKASRPAAELEGVVEDVEEELDVTPAHAGQQKEKRWGPAEATREWFQSTFCVAQDRYIPKIGMTGTYRNSKDCSYFKSGIFVVSGSVRWFQGCGGGYGYVDWMDAGWYVAVRCDSVFNRVHYSEVHAVSPSDSVWDMCTNWHY
jgi:hypothetical protein